MQQSLASDNYSKGIGAGAFSAELAVHQTIRKIRKGRALGLSADGELSLLEDVWEGRGLRAGGVTRC